MGAKSTLDDGARKACGRSRVSNGKTLFLEAVDGRSPMARRYRDVLADLVSDLGRDPTEAQSLIARRAATLAVWCEMEEAALASGNKFSIGEYTSAANTMHRLLAALGLERRMRDVTPTIDAYLNGGARTRLEQTGQLGQSQAVILTGTNDGLAQRNESLPLREQLQAEP